MPDKSQHRLGNLVLLPPKLNSALQDKPAQGKAAHYRKTGLLIAALLHESSLARTMPTDRILTCRCDTTLVGRGRSSD